MKSNKRSNKSFSQSQRNKADPIQIIAGAVIVVVVGIMVWIIVPKTSNNILSAPIPTLTESISGSTEPVVATVEPFSSATEAPITLPPTHESFVPFTVKIVSSNQFTAESRLELYLEFSFKPGDILLGTQIGSELNNGILELTLPSGEKKTYEQIPYFLTETGDLLLPQGLGIRKSPPPAGEPPINGYSFENYSDSPIGPQVRIPLDKISDISVIGEYQVTWKSGNLISNTLIFEWDGEKIIVHASTETPIPPTACIGSSGSWSTPPNGELSIIFTVQDCKITTVFILGNVNGQWLTMSEEVNEPIHGSEFNFLRNLSDQDRYSLSGTFSSPTSASIQLVLFKGLRFTTDQPSPLTEDFIINATATVTP